MSEDHRTGNDRRQRLETLVQRNVDGGIYDTDTRMVILDESACWALLGGQEFGWFVVLIANVPDIFPINFVVDDHSIVFRTAPGTKMAAAVLGRGVAFEVDGYDGDRGEAWSVVVHGIASKIEGWIEEEIAAHLPLFPWNASPKYDFVRIEVDELTGRRFHVADHSAWPEAGTPVGS